MSELAVPKHSQAEVSSNNQGENSDFEESLHSDTDLSKTDVQILLRESKSQGMFLTKTAGLFVVYTTFFIAVNLFIIFDMIRAKVMYRSMKMETMTWVYLGLVIVIKLLASCANKVLKKVQTLLFFIDCILSSFVFFGIFWFSETVNANAYEYNGHYVIIFGFCMSALSFGFMFSTLIRLKDKKYSVLWGVIFMSVFTVLALVIVFSVWTIHTMKFYQYFLVWFICTLLSCYIAMNSSFILKLREEKYYDNEIVYCFFCFFTDWFSMFWVDLFKSMFKKKKKKNRNRNRNRDIQIIER